MRLIIHDLKKEQADQFLPQDENTKVIYQKSEIKPCRMFRMLGADTREMRPDRWI